MTQNETVACNDLISTFPFTIFFFFCKMENNTVITALRLQCIIIRAHFIVSISEHLICLNKKIGELLRVHAVFTILKSEGIVSRPNVLKRPLACKFPHQHHKFTLIVLLETFSQLLSCVTFCVVFVFGWYYFCPLFFWYNGWNLD